MSAFLWWGIVVATGVAWVLFLAFAPEPPPRKSDCPHCFWYNPEPFGRAQYVARIDHMMTFHGIAVREEALR